MINIFAMESALLRTRKMIERSGETKAQLAIEMTTIFVQEAFVQIENWTKEVLAAMEAGDTLRTQLSILKKLTKRSTINTLALKRNIALKVIEAEKYVL
ncbi:hypothetical protein [Paenibacillus pini]|uniref:Butyryl-CoA dehydrogenase n=1 Tax=Paenibacillus pini JCM 16418 TaxID=1236976 RepID=W7Y8Y9_9BACL|nr:hypothetical protein [Paenibacillus pini]GAF07430.1 butyryl-CoA dehydrogenase [Paenibacillus pini JCM 16418]